MILGFPCADPAPGLTRRRARPYRGSVTMPFSRRSPYAHGQLQRCARHVVGGRWLANLVLMVARAVQVRPRVDGDVEASVPAICSTDLEIPSEAHVPAQQPAPPQDARLPAAYADPSRPRDPDCPAAQGATAPRRLRRRRSPRSSSMSCCRPATECVVRSTSPRPCAGADAPGARLSSCTWSSPTRMFHHRSDSS